MMQALLEEQIGKENFITLTNAAGDTAVVSLYGAHVVSWKTARAGEQLYCSDIATIANGRSIRAGIPVCFPQFSGFGSLPKHGLVRDKYWQPEGEVVSGTDVASARLRLVLGDSEATRSVWPYAFQLALDIVLEDNTLSVTLNVTNTGTDSFDFMSALHTYLRVADVRDIAISGLGQRAYIDATTKPFTDRIQKDGDLLVSGEVDRIYPAAAAPLTLQEQGKARLIVDKTGFADVVTWNPGPEKARELPDMPDEDWLHMMCLEAVQWEAPVVLQAGASWSGTQKLTVVAS